MGVKINDQFWFDKSEGIINNSITNLDKGIAQLNTYIVAIWVIYSGASIFSLDYFEVTNKVLLMMVLLPHVFLLLGRWFITQAQLPVTIAFDPRVPDDIENSYKQTYSVKVKCLRKANIITLIATALVVITLTYSFKKKFEQKNIKFQLEQKIKPDFFYEVLQKEKCIVFTGEMPAKTTIDLEFSITSSKEDKVLYAFKDSRISDSKGIVNYNFALPKAVSGTILLKCSWLEKNVRKSIIKYVKPKSKK